MKFPRVRFDDWPLATVSKIYFHSRRAAKGASGFFGGVGFGFLIPPLLFLPSLPLLSSSDFFSLQHRAQRSRSPTLPHSFILKGGSSSDEVSQSISLTEARSLPIFTLLRPSFLARARARARASIWFPLTQRQDHQRAGVDADIHCEIEP